MRAAGTTGRGDWWDREYVPLYVLRVPVRYYRRPPPYFRGWHADAPPRWGEHWGRDWEQRRGGWDQWDRHSAPRPAPLPSYQRKYSGDRYPRAPEQQHSIRSEKYRYQPREPVTQQYYQQQGHLGGAEPQRQAPVQQRSSSQQQHSQPQQQATPSSVVDSTAAFTAATASDCPAAVVDSSAAFTAAAATGETHAVAANAAPPSFAAGQGPGQGGAARQG